MPGHLISETALIAAEDAYEEIANKPFEQINRGAMEAAIKAYLATDPALAHAVEALRSIAAGNGASKLIAGLSEAVDIAQGREEPARVRTIAVTQDAPKAPTQGDR